MNPEDSKKADAEWMAKHSPINPWKLQALGVITFFWNRCQMALFVMFSGVTKIDANIAFALYQEMGDVSICRRIEEALDIVEHSDDVKSLVRDTLAVYDVNRLNRNQLTHFLPARDDSGRLKFFRQKGPLLDLQPFPDDLKDIRRVAEDVEALSRHLTAVGQYFLTKVHGAVRRPLPETPPLPERLWKPPSQDQPKQRSPQKS